MYLPKIKEVHTMEFNYNVTGERRKALVTTISEVLGMKAV